MPDPFRQPFDPLFNYASVSGELESLAPELTALADLVAYGTHLLPRLLASGQASFCKRVVLTELGRDALASADGLSVLSRVGAVGAAELQLRALFENSAYAQWILSGDREERARAYHSAQHRQALRWVDGAGTALEAIAAEIGRSEDYARVFDGKNGRTAPRPEMEPLRDLGNFPALLRSTMDLLLGLFRVLIEEYGPRELARFESDRVTYWSPPYPGRND